MSRRRGGRGPVSAKKQILTTGLTTEVDGGLACTRYDQVPLLQYVDVPPSLLFLKVAFGPCHGNTTIQLTGIDFTSTDDVRCAFGPDNVVFASTYVDSLAVRLPCSPLPAAQSPRLRPPEQTCVCVCV